MDDNDLDGKKKCEREECLNNNKIKIKWEKKVNKKSKLNVNDP